MADEAPDVSEAEALAKRRCAELHADALGLMFWERGAGRLTPLVYVPAADTLFWENSCGSGTAAVGAYLAKEQGTAVCVSLCQPGGTLEIAASPDGALRLGGTVRCVYEKTAVIEF
jgi:diaminopimelate epimerase